MVESREAAIADAAAAHAAGADLVEFRIDRLWDEHVPAHEPDLLRSLIRESPLPCIITCRSRAEGGEFKGSGAAVLELYTSLMREAFPPRYLDIELAMLRQASGPVRERFLAAAEEAWRRHDLSTSLIVSLHDSVGRPPTLLARLAEMRAEPRFRLLKTAYRARSLRDNIELFELLIERDRPSIALAMGEFGLMSRILAPKFGGFLTFAALRDASATAPGQPTITDLLHTYRFRSIAPSTKVFGVIGWPVAKSLSPLVHNAGFEATGFDGVYLPMPVPPEYEHFKATLPDLLAFSALDFAGASITMPHKQHVLRLAMEDADRTWRVDPLVRRAGAANTVTITSDGSIHLSNTDAEALASLLGAIAPLRGMRVGVLGAGGLARAAAAALAEAQAQVTLFARSSDKAARIGAELTAAGSSHARPVLAAGWGDRAAAGLDVFVNCTPLGMAGTQVQGQSPFNESQLAAMKDDAIIVETVYRPVETPLVRAARRRGLKVVTGDALFVAQAAAQFKIWTGRSAPVGLFERLVAEALGVPSGGPAPEGGPPPAA